MSVYFPWQLTNSYFNTNYYRLVNLRNCCYDISHWLSLCNFERLFRRDFFVEPEVGDFWLLIYISNCCLRNCCYISLLPALALNVESRISNIKPTWRTIGESKTVVINIENNFLYKKICTAVPKLFGIISCKFCSNRWTTLLYHETHRITVFAARCYA